MTEYLYVVTYRRGTSAFSETNRPTLFEPTELLQLILDREIPVESIQGADKWVRSDCPESVWVRDE